MHWTYGHKMTSHSLNTMKIKTRGGRYILGNPMKVYTLTIRETFFCHKAKKNLNATIILLCFAYSANVGLLLNEYTNALMDSYSADQSLL